MNVRDTSADAARSYCRQIAIAPSHSRLPHTILRWKSWSHSSFLHSSAGDNTSRCRLSDRSSAGASALISEPMTVACHELRRSTHSSTILQLPRQQQEPQTKSGNTKAGVSVNDARLADQGLAGGGLKRTCRAGTDNNRHPSTQ